MNEGEEQIPAIEQIEGAEIEESKAETRRTRRTNSTKSFQNNVNLGLTYLPHRSDRFAVIRPDLQFV